MLLRKILQLTFLFILLPSQFLLASPPAPFNAEYEIRFITGFRAEAELSLEVLEQGRYQMNSKAKLKIFGKTVTTVNVRGDLFWDGEKVMPQAYEYVQTGLGSGVRSIDYDWQNHRAETVVDDEEKEFILPDTMFDELTMYVEIQQQAAAGVEDIYLNVIDEDEIKEYHYSLVREETLETKLGVFNTVKYLRIREADSKRKTEVWLAKDWDYLVLRLEQKTKIRTFRINLLEAMVNNFPVEPLEQEADR